MLLESGPGEEDVGERAGAALECLVGAGGVPGSQSPATLRECPGDLLATDQHGSGGAARADPGVATGVVVSIVAVKEMLGVGVDDVE